MEFNGLLASDFNFFKKKEKLLKEDYEKERNDIKLHFRGLCYELQKTYHKKNGGVLEIEREFQNFNKRSTFISAKHILKQGELEIELILGADSLSLELSLICGNKDNGNWIVDILKNKKSSFWNYIMGNKNMYLLADFNVKNKREGSFKLSSLDINMKNYDNFIAIIEENKEKKKILYRLGIGYSFSKNECIKQDKNIVNFIYDGMINLTEFAEEILK